MPFFFEMHQGGQPCVYKPFFGHCRAFEGLPPPHMFEVIRQFFVMQEGIYRNFKGYVKGDNRSVLRAIDGVMQGTTFEELLALCESACAWNKGKHLLKKATMKK